LVSWIIKIVSVDCAYAIELANTTKFIIKILFIVISSLMDQSLYIISKEPMEVLRMSDMSF